MDQKKKNYVKKLIKYTKGDVEKLIESRIDKAGPLLMVVMNGIDALGGVCYGFRNAKGGYNNRDRSVKFMNEKMSIPVKLAEFLYESVRCGVVHEGMPKVRIVYDVYYDFGKRAHVFCKVPEHKYIHMDVVGFANRYLDAINGIMHEDYKDYPDRELGKAEELFSEAFPCVVDICYPDFLSKSSTSSAKVPRRVSTPVVIPEKRSLDVSSGDNRGQSWNWGKGDTDKDTWG